MVRVAEVAAAVLTGLGVTWALTKIDIGTIEIPTFEPPKEQPPPVIVRQLREGDACSSVNKANMPVGFTCIDNTVRPIGWQNPLFYRPDGKYTFLGYQRFVDSAASSSDYEDYLTGN